MSLDTTYSILPKDLSGSRTKNRFRQEILWVISKIYDLYLENPDDFFVIFDYVCDIEVGFNDTLHFYQVKTKDTSSPFSISDLIRKKNGRSYLSLLFSLKVNDQIKSINVVSNTKLSIKNTILQNSEIIPFENLEDHEKRKIEDHLKAESILVTDLKDSFFIRSDFCINNPDTLLIGKTVEFLENAKGIKLSEPKLIYNYIKGLVDRKASYELNTIDLNDTIDKKGIKRSEIDNILNNLLGADRYREITLSKIEALNGDYNYGEILLLKTALPRIFKYGITSKTIEALIVDISNCINENESTIQDLKLSEIIDYVYNCIEWDIIKDKSERKCLILLTLTKMESE